jgi:NAD(P)-dependent dehydrogenase (short-subunit alcohol dehydrogenase family)
MSDLVGRSAIVTGASRGIGLEVARALVAHGMRVILVARSADVLAARAAELGSPAVAMPCDLASDAAVSRLAHDVTSELDGAPDVVVNNAGAFTLAPVQDTTSEDFRRALDVNLVAPFLIVRAFLPAMRARGSGHIVTIGSVSDRAIFPDNGAYAASKFGLRALHEVLRTELRGTGIRASLVSPSAVDTDLWDEIDPDSRPGFTRRRDMLRSTAVASAVRFVLSQPADVNIDELRLSRS